MARSLNRVQLIGNLTRDPELRYTPQGTAVCTFGIATNRSWTTDSGEKRDEADFHRVVAWNKLGELCGQFLVKGKKVFVEGRLSTRTWTGQDGNQRSTTEVVISDMILLDSAGRRSTDTESKEPTRAKEAEEGSKEKSKEEVSSDQLRQDSSEASAKVMEDNEEKPKKAKKPKKENDSSGEIAPDDIPF